MLWLQSTGLINDRGHSWTSACEAPGAQTAPNVSGSVLVLLFGGSCDLNFPMGVLVVLTMWSDFSTE